MRINTEKYLNLGVDIIIYCGIVTHMKTTEQRWEEAKADPDRWIPRFPVKPCPYCGKEPMFQRQFGPGKYGKLTWHSIDYCGRIWADDDEYIGDAIAFWHEIVHLEMRAIKEVDKHKESAIVHTTSTEKPSCILATSAAPIPSPIRFSARLADWYTSVAASVVGAKVSRFLNWMKKWRTNDA